MRLSNNELLQRAADFRLGVFAEVWNLVAECLAECLPEIDRALEECLVVPQLRTLSARSPALVVEVAKESLWQRVADFREGVADFWEEDRRMTQTKAEEARRRIPHTPTLTAPVVAPAWEGQLPELPTERRMVLLNKV